LTPTPGLLRRDFLKQIAIGSGSFGTYIMPRIARAVETSKARSCIYILLQGGLSPYESFDPKPDAPAEYRGEFKHANTSVPGVIFSEHIPLLSQRLKNRFSIVRSAYHPSPSHNEALHMVLTGWPCPDASVEKKNRNENPGIGSVIAKLRAPNKPGLPAYVCIPHSGQLGSRVHYASASYLGSRYEPLDSGMVPESATELYKLPSDLGPNPAIPRGRLRDRIALRNQISASEDEYLKQAYEMLNLDSAAQAFDLNREPLAMRQRYGANGMGQQALLSRRLVEAGVPFTLVNFSLNQVKGQDWDTHEQNFKLMKNDLLPPMDRAVSVLLDDLSERGLLDSTLVVVSGEFGRTPKINPNAGRDHWPNVFSVLMAGGGIKPGIVLGSSTQNGAEVRTRPVHMYEILATIYQQLGVSTDAIFHDLSNRPMPVLSKPMRAVEELL